MLEEVSDLARLTALLWLTIEECDKLKTLPSIWHLSRLQEISIVNSPLQDMPFIEALSALRSLKLIVGNYARGCCAFTALSRSLPCLQQLQVLRLGSWIKDEDGSTRSEVAAFASGMHARLGAASCVSRLNERWAGAAC